MKNLLLFACLILVLVMAVAAYNYNTHITAPLNLPAAAPWQPAHIRIDAIHVNATVMTVGQNTDGTMDAPISKAINSPFWTSVFWYGLGAAPGQTGNAVIAGHVDRVGGNPAVFWSLSALRAGEMIIVTTNDHKELHFVINRLVRYAANAPSKDVLNAVFGPSTEHHLNLITCNGVWTGTGYDDRLVVFSTQVN